MAPEAATPQAQAGLDAFALTTVYHDTLRFFLNGTRVVVDEIDPEATLLEYLRGIGLTGTKLYVWKLFYNDQRLLCLEEHLIANKS